MGLWDSYQRERDRTMDALSGAQSRREQRKRASRDAIESFANALAHESHALRRMGAEATIGYCDRATKYAERENVDVQSQELEIELWICAVRWKWREYVMKLDITYADSAYCTLGASLRSGLLSEEHSDGKHRLVRSEVYESFEPQLVPIEGGVDGVIQLVGKAVGQGYVADGDDYEAFDWLNLQHQRVVARLGLFTRRYDVDG